MTLDHPEALSALLPPEKAAQERKGSLSRKPQSSPELGRLSKRKQPVGAKPLRTPLQSITRQKMIRSDLRSLATKRAGSSATIATSSPSKSNVSSARDARHGRTRALFQKGSLRSHRYTNLVYHFRLLFTVLQIETSESCTCPSTGGKLHQLSLQPQQQGSQY